MLEVEEQLRRYASAAERTVAPTARREGRPPRGPRRWLAVAAAAAVVGAALVVALDDDEPRVTTDPSTPDPPSTASTVTPDETTIPTTPAMSTTRTFPVTVVTERDYLVWAGEAGSEAAVRADGFAVDLRSLAVRAIPAAPIAPRSGATGVWTGEELAVCCGATGVDTRSAAAWSPDSGEWRVLAVPPASLAGSYATSVWTGDVMIVVAPGGAATYDPDSDAWKEIPSPLVSTRRPEAIWTGDRVVVWGGAHDDGVLPSTDDEADRGWSWRPGDDTWTPLPSLPPGHRTSMGSIAWTGREVVVWGQSTSDQARGVGARWLPGDEAWRPMRAHPSGPVELPFEGTPGSQTVVATGDGRVLVKDLDGSHLSTRVHVYDPESDTWQALDLRLGGYHPVVTVIAGDLVLVPDEARPVVGELPPG